MIKVVQEYFKLRGLVMPRCKDAGIFLTTEVGELLDAMMREEEGWVRNNDKESVIADEIADVYMMLLIVAECYKVDPVNALYVKMKRKLDEQEAQTPTNSPVSNILDRVILGARQAYRRVVSSIEREDWRRD